MQKGETPRIGILGCGVIGSAFAVALASTCPILLYNRSREKADRLAEETGAKSVGSLQELVEGSDLLLLAIKPKDFHNLAAELNPLLKDELVISTLSGLSSEKLRAGLPQGNCIRAMPNVNVRFGEGIFFLQKDPQIPTSLQELIENCFAPLGSIFWVEENQFAGMTVLAGCGPAFLLESIEAFIQAGVAMGLKPDLARSLATQTLAGTAALAKASSSSVFDLKLSVCSPGGITIEGINTLGRLGGKGRLVEALLASHKKEIDHS